MKIVTMCCTTCPSGCALAVTIDDNNQVSKVEGNSCPRGEAFAHKEWTDPVRTLTSTVFASFGGKEFLVPVKTSQPISRKLMGKAMEEIQQITLTAPVTMGDEIIADLAGSGISLVACKSY